MVGHRGVEPRASCSRSRRRSYATRARWHRRYSKPHPTPYESVVLTLGLCRGGGPNRTDVAKVMSLGRHAPMEQSNSLPAYARRDSNPNFWFRRPVSYPLDDKRSYGPQINSSMNDFARIHDIPDHPSLPDTLCQLLAVVGDTLGKAVDPSPWRPRRDSNSHSWIRSPVPFPLDDEAIRPEPSPHTAPAFSASVDRTIAEPPGY